MLRAVAGRPGRRRLLVSYFLAASLRCQASSVAGVTGKTSAQRRRGMNRVSAANQVRSPGAYRIRSAFRRGTAFSCRSTSNSAFFSPSSRITRTARLNNQRISRQTILSSTWPANHHRTSRAGKQAGQRYDRVSGRHRTPALRTLRPHQPKTTEAGPERRSRARSTTHILPADSGAWQLGRRTLGRWRRSASSVSATT